MDRLQLISISLGRQRKVLVMRLMVVTMGVVMLAGACGQRPGARSTSVPRDSAASQAPAADDSIGSIIKAYEAGAMTLATATQRMADVVEPMGGLAGRADMSPRIRELFDSVAHELSRRDARHYGLPDSIP